MPLTRAVVDTNVWISALLNPSGPPAAVRGALQLGKFVLIESDPLLRELAEVLARPYFARRYRIRTSDINTLLELLRERAEMVAISGAVQLCRDPDDDMFIESAFVGRASALVTRDGDLKGADDITRILNAREIAVLSVQQFLASLG